MSEAAPPLTERLAARLRGAPDPLAAAWRIGASDVAALACWAAVAAVAASALLLPGVYLSPDAALGLPLASWPALSLRLLALLRVGTTPWGVAVLAAGTAVAAARASRHAAAGVISPADAVAAPRAEPRRYVFHAESDTPTLARRLRLLLAPLGYRWHARGGGTYLLETGSARRIASAILAATACLLALLWLLWPRVAQGQVVALAPEARESLSVLPGASLLAGGGAGADGLTVEAPEWGPSRLLGPRGLEIVGPLLLIAHGAGPAVIVEPGGMIGGTSPAVGERLIILFLPGEATKYITLPQTQASLSLSLNRGSARPLRVAVLQPGAAEQREEYALARRTTLDVAGTLIAFEPTHYYLVSAFRLDLLWATIAALSAAAVSGLAVAAWRGETLRISLGQLAAIASVEVEAAGQPGLWRLLLRWALR